MKSSPPIKRLGAPVPFLGIIFVGFPELQLEGDPEQSRERKPKTCLQSLMDGIFTFSLNGYPNVEVARRTPVNFHDLARAFVKQTYELLYCSNAKRIQLAQLLIIVTFKVVILCGEELLKDAVDQIGG